MDILPTPRRFGRIGLRGKKADPDGTVDTDGDQVIDLTEPSTPELVLTSEPDRASEPAHQPEAAPQPEPERVATIEPAPPAPGAAAAVAAAPATRAAARAARATGRAGRNLPAAVGVGALLGALVIASLFVRKEAFLVLATLAIVVAVWELTEALAARHIAVPLVPVGVGAVGMVVAAFAAGGQALAVCFALTCLGVLVWRVAEGHVEGDAVRDVAGGLLVAAYVPLLGGFTMLLLSPHDGPWREVTFVLLVVGSDTGGFAAGVLFGKHPMAPSVSPKKSWEGFAGSVLACVLLGVGTVTLFLHGSWWAGALTGLAAVAAATVGDLGESLIKRDLGIKDMSSLLPGHGGLMDRLDSLLPTAPLVWLVLEYVVTA